MRRTAMAALVLAALTACSSPEPTPAERAFLEDVQKAGSKIEVDDPDGYLATGHGICEELAKVKPEDRIFYVDGYSRRIGYPVTMAAVTHLCPELKA